MVEDAKEKIAEIVVHILFWPTLFFPNASIPENIFFAGIGVVSWFFVLAFGLGFLARHLIG
jgi:hypothetical protein